MTKRCGDALEGEASAGPGQEAGEERVAEEERGPAQRAQQAAPRRRPDAPAHGPEQPHAAVVAILSGGGGQDRGRESMCLERKQGM